MPQFELNDDFDETDDEDSYFDKVEENITETNHQQAQAIIKNVETIKNEHTAQSLANLRRAHDLIDQITAAEALARNGAYPLNDIAGMQSTISQQVLAKLLGRVTFMDKDELIKKLLALKPGSEEPITFTRTRSDTTDEKNLDEFKMTIVRNLDNTFMLGIALKQKRIDFTKRPKKYLQKGGSKVLKIDLVVGATKPGVYAELTTSPIQLDRINSLFEKYKAALKIKKPQATEEELSALAKRRVDKYIQKKHQENLQEISIQQQFHSEKGFAEVICAEIKEKEVALATSGMIITVPQIVLLAPYRHTLFYYASGEWNPPGYSEAENNSNFATHSSRIIDQMLDVLVKMHDKNIEHRDIKLLNFLLDYNKLTGEITLEITDFGKAKSFGQQDSAEGTIIYFSPRQIQYALEGKTIAEAEAQAANEQPDSHLNNMVSSYGWRVLKEELAKTMSVNDPIPAPSAQTIDGRNDLWQFACAYFELVTGKNFVGTDECHALVLQNRFLVEILDQSKNYTAKQIKDLYLKSEYYIQNFSQPILRPQPSVASQTLSSWISQPLQQIDTFMAATTSRDAKKAAIRELRDLIPTSTGINLLLLNSKNIPGLKRLVADLQDYCNDIRTKGDKARKLTTGLDDVEWAENIGQPELVANIALNLACKLLAKYQLQAQQSPPPTPKQGRRPSLLFRMCYTAPTPATEAPIDYSALIISSTNRITDIAGAVAESLGPDSFIRTYGNRQN